MSDKDLTEKREDGQEERGVSVPSRSSNDDRSANDIPESPVGSQASRSSSSRRENRIVELLHDTDASDTTQHHGDNWVIRAEFYNEDVAADMDQSISDEEEDHSDVESEIVREVAGQHSDSDSHSDAEADFDELIEMGFVVAPGNEDQLSSSSDDSHDPDDGGDPAHDRANYDLSLPSTHRYLGENLEESRGRKFLVECSTVIIPIFDLGHIVLLPGQILPITTANSNQRIHTQLASCISSGRILIGIMSDPQNFDIGTTAEIRSYSALEDELRLVMEGRQRFKLLAPSFDTTIEGSVKILPEVSLGRPFPKIPSYRRFLTEFETTPKQFIVSKYPTWIVRQYESYYMVKKIVGHIQSWFGRDPAKDANDFSYWVAANLPMSNFERMKVLAFDCTEARLAWLLDMLDKSEFLGCSACKNVICHKRDVFAMSCFGPQNSFVNANGFVHDTLTVRSARGLMQETDWSTDFSWFPGYAWRIAGCENCGRHIGWCYKSTTAETKPKRFYGLSRANVRLQGSHTPSQVIPPYIV